MTNSPAQPDPTGQPTNMPPANESLRPATGQPAGPIVLTGTITEGVEPNCLLLDGYLLVGGPKDVIKAGARVVVTGQPEPDLMTTCQQGTPFRVARAQPA